MNKVKEYRIGVDIGGTFVDAIAINKTGHVITSKTSTTPDDLTNGVMNAVEDLGVDLNNVEMFVHGTTSGLNALLEKKGAKVGLITTKGFKDVLFIGRTNRPEIYNAFYKKPKPLINSEDIFEIDERIKSNGNILKNITENNLDIICQNIFKIKYESIAVCLINSYRNNRHETFIKEYLKSKYDYEQCIISSEIAPEWREYERTQTTVVAAYIMPIVKNYLENLNNKLIANGLDNNLLLMQSNGGIGNYKLSINNPLNTLLSGPVGGTSACTALSKRLKNNRLICVDMGGTSFDVSMVIDKAPIIESETKIEDNTFLFPSVSINTIGAGGGSIISFKAGGIKVGPESSGSFPGPACYSRGGKNVTVTDANLILGRLNNDNFSNGSIILDKNKSTRQFKQLEKQTRLDLNELAEGIINIADVNMSNAIREITVYRGLDPRNFTLVAFGGAGPLHSIGIAENLEINNIIIPAYAGIFSAWGMLNTDYRTDASLPLTDNLENITTDKIKKLIRLLKNKCIDNFSLNVKTELFKYYADLRYKGQEYSLTVEIKDIKSNWKNILTDDFHKSYFKRFGHSNTSEKIEIVNVRLAMFLKKKMIKNKSDETNIKKNIDQFVYKNVWWNGKYHKTLVANKNYFEKNKIYYGPIILNEDSTSTYVTPDWNFFIDNNYNIIMNRTDSYE